MAPALGSALRMMAFMIAFFWAVEHDQFDDMDTPKLLPLLDDPAPKQADAQQDDSKDTPA